MTLEAVKPSFIERLRANHKITKPSNPRTTVLRDLRGSVGHDHIENGSARKQFLKSSTFPH